MLRRLCAGLALLFFLLLGWHYQELARHFPFDFVWDMDITAAQDVLLLNSGLTPSHLDHPKYMMAVIQAAEAGLLQKTGILSTASLSDLAVSPQPMLGLAELTDSLRSVHALSTALLVALLAGLLWVLFPARPWLALLALPLLGLQAGPLYNALTMRTELYSCLSIAAGLWLCLWIWPRGSQASPRRQMAGSLALGLLLGLALLNKVQTLSLVFVLPAFAAYCHLRQPQIEDAEQPTGSTRPIWLVYIGSVCLFLILAALALGVPALPGRVAPVLDFAAIGQELPGSLVKLKLQCFWLGLIGAGPLAVWLAKRLSVYGAFLRLAPLFVAGTLLAFVFPLTALLGHEQGLQMGWQYLANLMRTTVWIDASLFASGSNSSAGTLSYILQHRSDLLLLPLAALALLLATSLQARRRPPAADLALVAVILACLATLVLGNRPILRDTLWFELWCSWAGLLGLGHLLEIADWRPLVRLMPALAVSVVALNSLLLSPREREAFYLYHAPYGGDVVPYDYFLSKSVYLRGANPYAQIFDKAFGENVETVRKAIAQARDWRRIEANTAAPFLNSHLPLRSVGLLEPGSPMWLAQGQWTRLEGLPAKLQGMPWLPLKALAPQPRGRRLLAEFGNAGFQGDLVTPADPKLTLVAPFYASLILALPKQDLDQHGWISDEPPQLLVKGPRGSIPYHLFRIEGHEVLDQTRLASLSAPALAIVYSASVQPPELAIWDPELSKWLGQE